MANKINCDICKNVIRELHVGVILDTKELKVLNGWFDACKACAQAFANIAHSSRKDLRERARAEARRYIAITEKIGQSIARKKKRVSCDEIMCQNKIYNRKGYLKWSQKGGHPDKGGRTAVFQDVLNCVARENYCR